MKVIQQPKISGKTTQLIKQAYTEKLVMVCCSKWEAERVCQLSKQMGMEIINPLTVDEFINGEFCGSDIKGFLIDNAEVVLMRLARQVPVKAATFTI